MGRGNPAERKLIAAQGARLKQARELYWRRTGRFESMADAARHLRIRNVDTYQKYEQGRSRIPMPLMPKLAAMYEVDFIWLFSGLGTMERQGIAGVYEELNEKGKEYLDQQVEIAKRLYGGSDDSS